MSASHLAPSRAPSRTGATRVAASRSGPASSRAVAPNPWLVVTRGRFGSTASRVLEHLRISGVASRDEIVTETGLSPATVGRSVSALVAAGLVIERPDKVRSGANGRPGIPVAINPETYVTIGIHLGRRVSTVALGDLTGAVVAGTTVPHDPGRPRDLTELGRQAARLLGRGDGLVPLTVGLVSPWADLGLSPEETAAELEEVLGLDVVPADHIGAVAAADYLHQRVGVGGVTAYFYARDTAGWAVAAARGDHVEVSRAMSLTHFPMGGDRICGCGSTGCLEAVVSDHAIGQIAHEQGIVDTPEVEAVHAAADAGSRPAQDLLVHRARTIGRAAAMVRDMVAPDRMILVGQACTARPEVIPETIKAFDEATAGPPLELTFTRVGGGIQAVSACAVALGPVYDDPMAALPQNRPPVVPRQSRGRSVDRRRRG